MPTGQPLFRKADSYTAVRPFPVSARDVILPTTEIEFGQVKLYQLKRWYLNKWIGVTGDDWTLRMLEVGGYYKDDDGNWQNDSIDIETGNPFEVPEPTEVELAEIRLQAATEAFEVAAARYGEAEKTANEMAKVAEDAEADVQAAQERLSEAIDAAKKQPEPEPEPKPKPAAKKASKKKAKKKAAK